MGDPDVRFERLGREVAGRPMVGTEVVQGRVDGRALFRLAQSLVQPATGVKAAAGPRVDRAGHVALEHDALAPPLRLGVGHGHRREQGASVRVARASHT